MITGEQVLPRAPLLSSIGLVISNLLPLWAVWQGLMSMGDVFIVYWLENVAVWAITIVKVRTARGVGTPGSVTMTMNGRPVDPDDPAPLAFFFALHYGIFTFVHGVFAAVMAGLAGAPLHPRTWLLAGLALVLSHVTSLLINWFGEGERRRVSPASAMWQPYPRMLVLHVAILASFGLLLKSVGPADTPSGLAQLVPVVILLGLKTVVDLVLHLWERRRSAPTPADSSSTDQAA